MKPLLLFLSLLTLTSCMGTQAYYDSQTAYYQAQTQAATAYMQAMNSRPPLAEMTAPDGTKFIVNQTGAISTPAIRQAENPIVKGIKTGERILMSGIIGASAVELMKAGNGEIHNSGSGTVTTNSYNPVDVTTRHTDDGDVVETNHDNSDWTDRHDLADDHSQTADPTIVEQPAPVIVDPVIVEQPPYNEPVIVEQPEPVIVEPVIVDPVVVQTSE